MSSTATTSRPGPIVLRGQPIAGNVLEQIMVPAMRTQTVVSVRGWATGYADPATNNATADMTLQVDGATVAKAHDAKFTLYNLEIEHTFLLAANTPATIGLTATNHIATEAGNPAHGVIATVMVV